MLPSLGGFCPGGVAGGVAGSWLFPPAGGSAGGVPGAGGSLPDIRINSRRFKSGVDGDKEFRTVLL